MRTKHLILIIALAVFLLTGGFAVRSTFVMHDYANKPIGGAMMLLGFIVLIYLLLKSIPKY